MKFLQFLILLLYPIISYSGNSNDEGMDFANSFNKGLGDNPNGGHEFNKISGLDASNVPFYKGENVEEKEFYSKGLLIEEEGKEKSSKDEVSKLVKESSDNKSNFTFNQEKDPMFLHLSEISDSSHQLTETSPLSEVYTGCRELPVGVDSGNENSIKMCSVKGVKEQIFYSCDLIKEPNCSNPDAGQEFFRSINFSDSAGTGDSPVNIKLNGQIYEISSPYRRGSCSFYRNIIRFSISSNELVKQFKIFGISYDDWLDISVNGNLVFRAMGPHIGLKLSGNYDCEFGRLWTNNETINIEKYLNKGVNTIEVVNEVHGGGQFSFKVLGTLIHDCKKNIDEIRRCEGAYTGREGKKIESKCIESAKEKEYKGFKFYSQPLEYCWKYKEKYTVDGKLIFDNKKSCKDYYDMGCNQLGINCVHYSDKECDLKELKFLCPFKDSKTKVTICGDDLVCPNGNCTKDHENRKERPATEDFKQSAANLALLKMITENVDPNDLNVRAFSGKSRKCKIQKIGFKNCCRDSGWGVDLGLTSCDSNEKELGLARQAHRDIKVGSYKAKDGVFYKATYEVYCIYPSKLARIFIAEGNRQLGRGYGDPHNPICDGIKIDEIEKLDFNKMNLSEFYDDIMQMSEGNKNPNIEETINRVKEKIKKGQHG